MPALVAFLGLSLEPTYQLVRPPPGSLRRGLLHLSPTAATVLVVVLGGGILAAALYRRLRGTRSR